MVDDLVVVWRWRTKKRLAQLDRVSYFLSLHEQIGGAQARWRCSGSWLSSKDEGTAAGEARQRCTNSPGCSICAKPTELQRCSSRLQARFVVAGVKAGPGRLHRRRVWSRNGKIGDTQWGGRRNRERGWGLGERKGGKKRKKRRGKVLEKFGSGLVRVWKPDFILFRIFKFSTSFLRNFNRISYF